MKAWKGVGLGLGLLVLAGLGTVTAVNVFGPERVPDSEIALPENQPLQVAQNKPVEPAPADADFTEVVDVFDEVARVFQGDLRDVRGQVLPEEQQAGANVPVVTAVHDECLQEWAQKSLPVLAEGGTYAVLTVCDRDVAVLAGPTGADSKVLVYGSLEDSAPEGMRETLAESTASEMALVALRTADGKAQVLMAAEPAAG